MTASDRQAVPLLRLIAAGAAIVLLVGLLVAFSRARTADGPGGFAAPEASPGPTPEAEEPAPDPSPTPPAAAEVPGGADGILADPEAAERAGAGRLLEAGLAAAEGPWADLGHPDWPAEERPVYVGTVELLERRRVSGDLAVAFRAREATDTVTLRLVPASDVLEAAGAGLSVSVRRDGTAAPHLVDRDGARLEVTLDPPVEAGEAVLLRVTVGYRLVDAENITDDGGPAGFGLLAWNPEASVLGHWLPTLTVPTDDGPMIPWGDVGAFPTAVWSVQVRHDGATVVTGGHDGACPAEPAAGDCVWSRGVALRDVSAVAYDEGAVVDQRETAGVTVRAVGPDTAPVRSANATALDESVDSVELFTDRLGPLAWREFDVAAAPLAPNAAGMEFPGLVVIRDDVYDTLEGGFGTFVLTHEVAHQWFHALVGNGSLSSPVVDESLAQYLSYLYYVDELGQQVADEFIVGRNLRDRYERARNQGLRDEPPAQPLEEFDGQSAYGPLVYARGALAWVEAEEQAGRDTVVAFLGEVVRDHGLGFVTDDELVAAAREFSPELGAVLERYWLDPTPLDAPTS